LKRKLDSNGSNGVADGQPEVKKVRSEQEEKEYQLKVQTQNFWKLRDSLDKELPNDVIRLLLQDNEQELPKLGRDDVCAIKFLS
jgi:hypothetical protein